MTKKERFNAAYSFLYNNGWIHNQKEAAEKMRTSAPNMSSARNGVESVLTKSFLKRFADAFPAISEEWLINGTGEMLTLKNSTDNIAKSFRSGVPYFNVDFALGFDLMENDQTHNPDYLIDCPPYNKCDLWCNAHGDSMAPTIASGDIVALKRIEDFRHLVSGEIYALITKNGLRTIKRVNDNGNTFTLISDNKDYQPQTLPKEEFTHVFVVKGSMKAF